jgi:hypothetical protein
MGVSLQQPSGNTIIQRKVFGEVDSTARTDSVEVAMNDMTTDDRLMVSTDGSAGPYIVVPVDQITTVTALLDANSVPYWVDEEAISIDGRPEDTVINLGLGTDPGTIQNLLDSTS